MSVTDCQWLPRLTQMGQLVGDNLDWDEALRGCDRPLVLDD